MKRTVFVVDSGADLPENVINERGFYVVRMYANMGNVTLHDGEFPAGDLFRYFETTGHLPKTSACTQEDFDRVFDLAHAEHPKAQIVYLACSSAISCTYQNAERAAAKRDYVTLIDTRICSAGLGAVVLQTDDWLREHPNASPEDIRKEAERIRARIHTVFMPDDLRYLRAGGRLSNAAYPGTNLLNIRPLCENIDGKITCTRRYRGSTPRVFLRMMREYIESHHFSRDVLYLAQSYGLSATFRDDAEACARSLGFRQIVWFDISSVVSVHTGPGAFELAGLDEPSYKIM